MKAIDTNIVVRFLTGEDHPQTTIARNVIAREAVFVSNTVTLETAWVLRNAYGFARQDIVQALRAFVGLPVVTLESPDIIVKALDRAADGMDFADALHLGAAAQCDGFLTFDRKFIRSAEKAQMAVSEPT